MSTHGADESRKGLAARPRGGFLLQESSHATPLISVSESSLHLHTDGSKSPHASGSQLCLKLGGDTV